MSSHRCAIRWASAAFGVGIWSWSAPARADNLGKLGEALVLLVLVSGLNVVFALGILIAAVVWGRRDAPLAPWKRTLAVLGTVFASLCTAWNCMVSLVGLAALNTVASRPDGAFNAGFVLGVTIVPLAVSVCAIVYSAKLYGKNKAATAPPPPYYHQPPLYPPPSPPPQPPQAPG